MKNANFKLKSLQVKSFITSVEAKHIRGAGSEVEDTPTMPYAISCLNSYCKIK